MKENTITNGASELFEDLKKQGKIMGKVGQDFYIRGNERIYQVLQKIEKKQGLSEYAVSELKIN